MTLRLDVITGKERFETTPSSAVAGPEKAYIIGRADSCDWALPDTTRQISGNHCEIKYEDGAYILRDLSTNGTFLDGSDQRIDGDVKLETGSQIKLGNYVIGVTIDQDALAAFVASDAGQRLDAAPQDRAMQRNADPASFGSRLRAGPASDSEMTRIELPKMRAAAPVPLQTLASPLQKPPSDLPAETAVVAERTVLPVSVAIPPVPAEPAASDPWGAFSQPLSPVPDLPPIPDTPVVSPAEPELASEPPVPVEAMPEPEPLATPSLAEALPPEPEPQSQPEAPVAVAEAYVAEAPVPEAAAPVFFASHMPADDILGRAATGLGIPVESLQGLQPGDLAELLGRLVRLSAEDLKLQLGTKVALRRRLRPRSRHVLRQADLNPLLSESTGAALAILLSADPASPVAATAVFGRSYTDLSKFRVAYDDGLTATIAQIGSEIAPVAIEARCRELGVVKQAKEAAWDLYRMAWHDLHDDWQLGFKAAFDHYLSGALAEDDEKPQA